MTVLAQCQSLDFLFFSVIKTALLVASCFVKGSFWALWSIIMYSRSTICNKRLSALALLYTCHEKDWRPEIILNKLITVRFNRPQLGQRIKGIYNIQYFFISVFAVPIQRLSSACWLGHLVLAPILLQV